MPRRPSAPFRTLGALALGAAALAGPAAAQRPYSVYDPFYRGETARRGYDGAYALTGEASYRTGGAARVDALGEPGPLGLALRLDYGLARHLDVGAIVDASDAGAGRSLAWAWVVGRYFWTTDEGDYSFRLALDPASDGRVGFPQADLAFLATTPFSPTASSDFALGVRRVQRGYQQLVPVETPDVAQPPVALRDYDVFFNRAYGWELHVMTAYNVLLGPSGSRAYAGLAADRGEYELQRVRVEETEGGAEVAPGAETPERSRSRGGVVWMRGGIEVVRPNYRVAPFVGLPVVQWTPAGTVPARPIAGVEFTLR